MILHPARPQNGWIDQLRIVSGANDNDALIAIDTRDLLQQRIDNRAPPIAALRTIIASRAERIEFIDEQDAGGAGAGLGEDARHGAQHIPEMPAVIALPFGIAGRHEANVAMRGDGAGERGLGGAGHATEEQAPSRL